MQGMHSDSPPALDSTGRCVHSYECLFGSPTGSVATIRVTAASALSATSGTSCGPRPRVIELVGRELEQRAEEAVPARRRRESTHEPLHGRHVVRSCSAQRNPAAVSQRHIRAAGNVPAWSSAHAVRDGGVIDARTVNSASQLRIGASALPICSCCAGVMKRPSTSPKRPCTPDTMYCQRYASSMPARIRCASSRPKGRPQMRRK